MYIAHIRKSDGTKQTCREHCMNTARIARENLNKVNLGYCGYLAGILHDCGKYSTEFQTYITLPAEEKPKKGSVIHSFAGAVLLLKRSHATADEQSFDLLTSEILAASVASHHGLMDCVDINGNNGFNHRINKQPTIDEEAICSFTADCLSREEYDRLFRSAANEIQSVVEKIAADTEETAEGQAELFFKVGALTRLVSSAVMDGDRRDTAEFETKEKDVTIHNTDEFWKECLNNLETRLAGFACRTEIDKARKSISDMCASAAEMEPGIYKLNVPTGGGKTLSSMRYALNHAIRYQKRRIIYVAPLITILEQNAEELRKSLGKTEEILEHYSSLVIDKDAEEELSRHELLTETWDAPVIITTLVQLLNTMFAGQTSSVRRFHTLCDSILILDEVQSVPIKLLSLFNQMLNFLTSICGATVILCSATQPTFESAARPLKHVEGPLLQEEEMKQFSGVFKRTEIVDAGAKTENEIGTYLTTLLAKENSLLVVCNKKAEAEALYYKIKHTGRKCFHLSAAMCKEHRSAVLKQVRESLERHEPICCVSTQVVEAGVDISFHCVARYAAGLDSIVQAAGRCNRNGESTTVGKVYIMNCTEENLYGLREIEEAKKATVDLLHIFRNDPASFSNDLASEEAVNYYYTRLYTSFKRGRTDYPQEDRFTLYEMLSENERMTASGSGNEDYDLHQAFREAGKRFSVFDTDTVSVIVPYGRGIQLINELNSEKSRADLRYAKQLLKEAQNYTVTKSVSGDKKENQERGSDTMGMKHFVRFGVYLIKGSINVQLAEKTGFSQEDAEIVKECLRTLFVNDASAARPDGSMEVVKLFWWQHNCKDGQYSSAKVHRSLHVALKDGVEVPSSAVDYEFTVEELPDLRCDIIDGI